jgi:hypothetical protein
LAGLANGEPYLAKRWAMRRMSNFVCHFCFIDFFALFYERSLPIPPVFNTNFNEESAAKMRL